MRTFVAVIAATALCACQTVFTGAAKVKDGPYGCWQHCNAWGMDLAGMVKMGEYSDGCICQVRPQPPQQAPPQQQQRSQQPGSPSAESDAPRGGEGSPAVAGVWSAMQATQAAAAAGAAHQRQMDAQRHGSMGLYGGGHIGRH